MERGEFILAICIPTYNRVECLAEFLSTVCSQIDGLSDKVCVAISDNASTDHTREVVAKMVEQHSNISIFYYRNDINIGATANFQKATSIAPAKFVWLFGDDDLLMPLSVKKVLHVLEKEEDIGFLFLNSLRVSDDYTEILRKSESELKSSRRYGRGYEIFRGFSYQALGHISRCVYLKSSWQDNKAYINRKPWQMYPQLFALLDILKDKPCYFLSDPIVISRAKGGNEYWRGYGFVSFCVEFPMLEYIAVNEYKLPKSIFRSSGRKIFQIITNYAKLSFLRERYEAVRSIAQEVNTGRSYYPIIKIIDLFFSVKLFRTRLRKMLNTKLPPVVTLDKYL